MEKESYAPDGHGEALIATFGGERLIQCNDETAREGGIAGEPGTVRVFSNQPGVDSYRKKKRNAEHQEETDQPALERHGLLLLHDCRDDANMLLTLVGNLASDVGRFPVAVTLPDN